MLPQMHSDSRGCQCDCRGCWCFCRYEKCRSGTAKSPGNDTGGTGTLKQMKRLGKFCTSFVVLLSFPPDSLGYTVANQEVVGTKMLLILRCSQHRNIQQYDTVLEMDLRTLQRSVGSNMLLVVTSIFKPIK